MLFTTMCSGIWYSGCLYKNHYSGDTIYCCHYTQQRIIVENSSGINFFYCWVYDYNLTDAFRDCCLLLRNSNVFQIEL